MDLLGRLRWPRLGYLPYKPRPPKLGYIPNKLKWPRLGYLLSRPRWPTINNYRIDLNILN
jgi:hypothetical protein